MKTSAELAEEADDYDFETEHDTRKREVFLVDPTNTINLRDYLQVHHHTIMQIRKHQN